MERLVVTRLKNIIKDKNLFSSSQSGFRAQRSTNDQLVENKIKTAINSNMTFIAVFIDLAGAFDKVWHLGLLKKLQLGKIEGKRLAGLIHILLIGSSASTSREKNLIQKV